MTALSAEVNLFFNAMDRGYRVRVTPRQLFFLDLYTERRVEADGTVSYILPQDLRRALWSFGVGAREASMAA